VFIIPYPIPNKKLFGYIIKKPKCQTWRGVIKKRTVKMEPKKGGVSFKVSKGLVMYKETGKKSRREERKIKQKKGEREARVQRLDPEFFFNKKKGRSKYLP
jgi:hypothetical protein